MAGRGKEERKKTKKIKGDEMKMRETIIMMALIMFSACYAMAEQRMMQMTIALPVEVSASCGDKCVKKQAAPAKKPAPAIANNSEAKELKKATKEAKEAAKLLQEASREAAGAAKAAKIDLFPKNTIDKIADKGYESTTASIIDKKDLGYKFVNCASVAAVGAGIKSQNSTAGGVGGAVLISSYYFKKEITKWDILTSALCGGVAYLLAQAPSDSAPVSDAGDSGGGNDNPLPPGTGTGPVLPPPVP